MATCPTMRQQMSVGQSYKCLIQLEEQNHVSRKNSGVTKYNLCDGLQVLVCQGDITTQWADALVNAANEDLEHGGGVAAALSKAGGPQVQIECRAMVKQIGKIPTGDVAITTGGNLKCKKLLHAVGPVNGKCGGKERMLLEKTVSSALNLAEMKKFTSIAMPCISSGLFCVPLTVCAEAIATVLVQLPFLCSGRVLSYNFLTAWHPGFFWRRLVNLKRTESTVHLSWCVL
uniref:Macro domain-containing protein n=1 Tax=Astatotilapia calliptera TaxID=8154 RepID=A0AAX7VAM1_ASTCA